MFRCGSVEFALESPAATATTSMNVGRVEGAPVGIVMALSIAISALSIL